MNKASYFAASALVLLLSATFTAPAGAQQRFSPHELDLYDLIEAAAAETGKEIIYNQQMLGNQPGIASTSGDAADYETLLAALRTIGLAAIESGEQIRIVPDAVVRTEPSRLLQQDDRNVSDHTIVTRVIEVPPLQIETADGVQTMPSAPTLVPILRPMLGINAQLGAAQGTNQLIVVDRYDNVRRMTEIVNAIVAGF